MILLRQKRGAALSDSSPGLRDYVFLFLVAERAAGGAVAAAASLCFVFPHDKDYQGNQGSNNNQYKESTQVHTAAFFAFLKKSS